MSCYRVCVDPQKDGRFDPVILDTKHSILTGRRSNLLVRRHGTWLTPPLGSGCLPGVMRACCLASGLAREDDLGEDLLKEATMPDDYIMPPHIRNKARLEYF